MNSVPTSAGSLSAASARRARLGVSLAFFANGAAFASWVSRIPALREGLHLGDGALGSVLFAMSIGVLLSFPLAGRVVQWLGPRQLAVVAGALLLLMLPVPFAIGILPSLVLVMLELGLANGTMDVAMNVLAVEVELRIGRPIMSSVHGVWSLGGLVGASVGGLAAHAGLAPTLHLALVSVVLATVLCGAGLLLRGVDLARPKSAAEPAADAAVAPAGRFAGVDRVLVGLGLVCFCCFLTEGALADWSAVFLRERAHASESLAAFGYAMFAGTMTAMRLVGDRVIARFGAARPLRAFNAVGALALAAALVTQQAAVALAAFALMGLGLATVVPSAFGAAARHAEAQPSALSATVRSARAIALMAGFGYGGLLVGPPVIGWVAQAVGLPWALGLLVALVGVIATLVPLVSAGRRFPAPAPAPGAAPVSRAA